jgi:hypothetical protein
MGSRLIDAYVSGLKLAVVHVAMTPAGLAFGCGPAPAGPEIEAATFSPRIPQRRGGLFLQNRGQY